MKLTNRLIIFLILLIATILRCYHYFDIPFTHDEFSALFRLNFDSFSRLIDEGVKVDGHPAGVQVFLYYWTRLFGSQEWVVKLPFTIMGIASVYMIFLLGRKWFNETVGLIAASYLASIQMTIMYSQIARPYISGLFFCLVMVIYWSNLMLNPRKNFYKNCVLFVVFASLCSYNHHFSLLFAALVGISGLFFIQKKFLLSYVISGLLIFILYIPHLKVFFYQLDTGGIEGWLGKPNNDFLLEYISYIFQYSAVAIFIAIAISIMGLLYSKKSNINYKYILLALFWFVTPFLVGFFYSRYVNAVLQFSVLIFSLPFLFFLLFGHLKEQTAKINLVLVSVIIISNVLTLIYHRDYYDIFYNSIYKKVLTDYEEINQTNKSLISIIDSKEEISRYYHSKLLIDSNYISYSDSLKDVRGLKKYLEATNGNHGKLYFGCLSSMDPVVVSLIQDYYPTIEIQNNYFGGTVYLFNKVETKNENLISRLDFDSEYVDNWSSINKANFIPNSDNNTNCYSLDSNTVWGPMFTIPLKDIIDDKNNFIDISVSAYSEERFKEVVLVGQLESNGEKVYWGGTEFEKFDLADNLGRDWINIHHSIELSSVNLNHDDIILKVNVWNKGKSNLVIDDFKIKLRSGNPIIYGLYERL